MSPRTSWSTVSKFPITLSDDAPEETASVDPTIETFERKEYPERVSGAWHVPLVDALAPVELLFATSLLQPRIVMFADAVALKVAPEWKPTRKASVVARGDEWQADSGRLALNNMKRDAKTPAQNNLKTYFQKRAERTHPRT